MRSLNASWNWIDRRSVDLATHSFRLLAAAMLAAITFAGVLPHATWATDTGLTLGTEAFAEGATQAETPPDFAAMQEECRQRIGRLRVELVESKASRSIAKTNLTQELELWEQLELIVEEWRSAFEDRRRHEQESSHSPHRFVKEAPKAFLEVDDLRARRESVIQRLESLRLELQSEKGITINAKHQYQEAEQIRRRSDEAYERSAIENRVTLHRAQVLAQLQSRVLKARLDLHREQTALLTVHVQVSEDEVADLDAVINSYGKRFKLTREELDHRLSVLVGFEDQVRKQIADVDERMRASMRQRANHPDLDAESAYEIAREESQLLRQLLAGASQFKESWRRRYALSNFDVPANDIEQWLEEAAQIKVRVAQIGEKLRLRTQQRRESLSLLTRSLGAVDGAAVDGTTLDNGSKGKVDELQRIIDFYGSIQVLATSGERLCQLLTEDLEAQQDHFSLSDNLELLQSGLSSAWQYEIATIEDEPITVKKLVLGLALLLCGYFISRALASLFAHRVLPRFGVSQAAASVLRTVLFYLLLTALAFVSLDIVNVPLTVFAFLGGAVAIGVGFGSQNLINNFISGLILLVERPIRVGDLVNVDGIDANVEHIGARSTRVRTGSNLEIMVPNSKFLEKNVTNWTLSDTRIRTSVSVGVAYGSPVREVIERLTQVIGHHEKVLTSPEPIVLFKDFGDSSLAFEVHFWIHMKRIMDGAKVRSDVRAAIDDDFRDAGIVIAFPQRDVHIDMQSPLEVRLSNADLQSGDHRLRRVG
ncbi:MAG: mechanosensitive ion channel domain-containing protein [Rubripirellula sp.]